MSRLDTVGTQMFDNNGDPLAGGKLTFYETGTTTLATTYSDSGLTSANANPVVLDAAGRMPDVFFSGLLKVVLSDANDVVIETRDPVGIATSSVIPSGGTTGQVLKKASDSDLDIEWADDETGGSGGGDGFTYDWTSRDTDFTAAVNYHYLLDGEAGSQMTVTLPASPSVNDKVGFYVLSLTNDPAFDENSLNYKGGDSGAGTYEFPAEYNGEAHDREPRRLVLIYSGATNGWINLQGELVVVPA